jgi:hypothetical protein
VIHHLGVFAENAVCAFHFWEDFQGRTSTKIGFPVFLFFFIVMGMWTYSDILQAQSQNGDLEHLGRPHFQLFFVKAVLMP